jgi:hypothetical protein
MKVLVEEDTISVSELDEKPEDKVVTVEPKVEKDPLTEIEENISDETLVLNL